MTAAPAKPRFPREQALVVAEEVYQRLKPFCTRCKIVGSLRRHRKMVGDIEVLFIPKYITEPDGLFETKRVSVGHKQIEYMLSMGFIEKRKNVLGSEVWGQQNMLARHIASGIPVDFFSTTEEKWWVSLVIRTGGKRTNLALTMGANKRGLTLNAYGSGFTDLKTGEKIPCNSEEDVFRIAGIPFSEPQFRQ